MRYQGEKAVFAGKDTAKTVMHDTMLSLKCIQSHLGQYRYTVELPLMASSLHYGSFLADSPYIHSCFNLSTKATFFCPQGGRRRVIQR